MSHFYYNSLWADAQQEYRSLLQEERKIVPGVEETDRLKLYEFLSDLYIKYVSVFKKLDSVYDQTVHPQKRPLIRKILDLTLIRILEMRQVMVHTELSEFLYFDDFMQWMHWIPDDLDVDIPKYYYHERGPEFALREKWLDEEHCKKLAEEEAEAQGVRLADEDALLISSRRGGEFDDTAEVAMSYEKAILTVQTVERARQGRARFEMARYIYEEEEKTRGRKKRQRQQYMEPNQAAVIIQRLVRRFIAYRRVQRRRNEELGLTWNPHKVNSPMGQRLVKSREWKKKIEAHAQSRREVQRAYQKTFMEAQGMLESKLRLLEAPQMAEELKSQLRNWMLQAKEKTGKLPDMPKAELGGSKYLFCPERQAMDDAMSEKAMSVAVSMAATERGGKKKKGGKDSSASSTKDKEQVKESKKGKKKGGAGDLGEHHPDGGLALEPPKYFQQMIESNVDYNVNWRHRDETHNVDQCHEDELIIQEKRQILENEVRTQVDVIMKSELQLLKDALLRRKGKKGKKTKKGGKGGKKGGKKGKKKKKKMKDLTPDRTLESLYGELVYNGVIRKIPKILFQDLYGECSLVNGSIRKFHSTGGNGSMLDHDEGAATNFPGNPNPPPNFGDIKKVMKDICVLPVGSITVHQMAPFIKSLLLTGAEGSGKKSLVYAVCNELGATFFDLTPANIAGQYPGKPGLNMLMHLIAKVGRLAQPTVIFIDECEKTFQKRVPKTDKTEPKRLKKHLVKFVKSIGPEDQIILISLSHEPWQIPVKLLKKDFQKIIYIPKPDHGDRIIIWQQLLAKHMDELHHDVNMSVLAKVSDGWTMGALKECVNAVTAKHYQALAEEKRRRDLQAPKENWSGVGQQTTTTTSTTVVMRIGRKLIRMDDFLRELSLLDPIFLEQEKLWNNWFSKTPLQKLRIAAQEVKMESKAKEKKGKGKKKKGK